MVGIWRSIYKTLNWHYPSDPPDADPLVIRQRHLVIQQIKKSKFKLKKVIKDPSEISKTDSYNSDSEKYDSDWV